MIEYLYDAVRTSDGEDMTITATIRDNDGTTITDGCALRIFDEGGALIEEVGGTYYTDGGSCLLYKTDAAEEKKEFM